MVSGMSSAGLDPGAGSASLGAWEGSVLSSVPGWLAGGSLAACVGSGLPLVQAARLSTMTTASSIARNFFIANFILSFHLFRTAAPSALHVHGAGTASAPCPKGRAHYIASVRKTQGLFALYTDFSQTPTNCTTQYPCACCPFTSLTMRLVPSRLAPSSKKSAAS